MSWSELVVHLEQVRIGPAEVEEAVAGQGSQGHEHEPAPENPSAVAADSQQDQSAQHDTSATGSAPAAESPGWREQRRSRAQKERRSRAAALIGAIGVTVVSVVFIISFIAGLHKPGPRSVPLGIVGTSAQASALSTALGHQAPGGFTVAGYPTQAAATSAITDRRIDAALVPGPRAQLLLVATAAGEAVTNATIQDVHAAVHGAGLSLVTQNIHPLPANDPQGLSQVFFVVALLARAWSSGTC